MELYLLSQCVLSNHDENIIFPVLDEAEQRASVCVQLGLTGFSFCRDRSSHDLRHRAGHGHVLGDVALERGGDHGNTTHSCGTCTALL